MSNFSEVFGTNDIRVSLSMLFAGSLITYTTVWTLGDVGIGLITVFNIVMICLMSGTAFRSLKDYEENHCIKKQ